MPIVTRFTFSGAAIGSALLVCALSSAGAHADTPTKSLAGSPKQTPYLGPQQSAPSGNFSLQADAPFTQTGNFTVDVGNRQQVQAFFNSIYTASENTPLTFTGNIASCSPGTTNALFKNAVRLRINWFREMAGVNDTIAFNPSFSSSAQDAALIMAANGLLTHTPASSLTCYTSTGEDGAGSSNLALGTLGWDSITGYMEDSGSNNAAVGHRRWLLHPPIEQMGTGDVAATAGSSATNAIWVFDDNIFADGAMRDGYVAWPPPAFIPYNVVPARWSFSLKNANFSSATVSMTLDGSPITTTLEPVESGAGLDTLVWIPLGLDAAGGEPWPQPEKDETLGVQIDGVLINGSSQSFSYDVKIFDSTINGESDQLPTITGVANTQPATAERFDLDQVDFAASYNLRSGTLAAFTALEDAEGSSTFVADGTDSAYSLFTTDAAASGSTSLHLAHTNSRDQFVVIERQILPSASSELRFASRLGFASATQVARAQASLDDGQTWSDVYSQVGSGGRGETSFSNKSASLASYADSVIKIRFTYDLLGGSFFPQSSSGVGFYIDDVQVTNAQELTNIVTTSLANVSEFSYTPEGSGEHLLQVQYLGWEGFAGSAWGPVKTVSVADFSNNTAIAASVLPASRSVFNRTATAFASIINGGAEVASNCRIVPQNNSAITFSYQTTNSADNSLSGTLDTPVDIAPGAVQSFALFMTPTGAFAPTEIALSFDCANSAPAPAVSGLTTLLLASGSGPVPDIIALAATGSPGIVEIPGDTATGVFAVATVNAGSASSITASARGPAGVTVQICQTNPTTGACLGLVAASVTTSIASGATPTFGFFVTGSGNVPFDPANNRVHVTFADDGGLTRGATSVAIRTN